MGLFSKIGSHLDMMQEMFQQTGALGGSDQSFQSVPSLRQAIHRCASCSHTDACRKWLDFGIDEKLQERPAPNFCANQGLQEELKLKSL